MEYKIFLIFWLCGVQTLFQVSSKTSDTQYLYQNELHSDTRTRIVPLQDRSLRLKRDVNSTEKEEEGRTVSISTETTTTTTETPALGPGTDEVERELNKVLTETDDEVHKNLHSPETSFKYDNETLKYYSHKVEQGTSYFYDLDHLNTTGPQAGNVKQHNMLSQSYRRAATINLSFKFPFYGHAVENITIATGGFLYTGDYVHSWLAATQYIAPLMANFDTSNNHQAKIRYLDDGSKLVVEWKDVYLQERESEGPFTFQVTLHQKGDIWFAYQKIPLEIISIKDDDHPVKVGLSDAYIIDRTIYFARRKTIYEYHRLNLMNQDIRNETAIVFTALKTCNINRDCGSCLAPDDAYRIGLQCRWCP